jgi:hypothetical protein
MPTKILPLTSPISSAWVETLAHTEPTRKPDTPMSSAEVNACAERAFSLHCEHGVRAGPKVMIDEFLLVLRAVGMEWDGLGQG